MSSKPVSMAGVHRRCGPVSCLGLVIAVLAAGCVGGDLPTTSAPATLSVGPAAPVQAIKPLPDITAVPASKPRPRGTTTPRPTEIPGPPVAALASMGGHAIPGALGGFRWRGMGSDAPWLVPPADQAERAMGPYMVTFAPPLLVEGWTARWAPVVDGAAGAVAGSEQGDVGPVVLEGPDRAGAWSLQVDVRFAGGGRCAYYWRLETAP